MITTTFHAIDLDRLHKLATEMARTFPSTIVIGLVGTLGAGKTTFAQAIASATGVDPENVTSPTFTLLCSYDAETAAGPIRLHHLDAYRLADEDEFLELGVDELFDGDNAWTLIEWADRVESVLPRETLWISIDVAEADASGSPMRTVTLTTQNPDLASPMKTLAEAMASNHPVASNHPGPNDDSRRDS